MTIYTSYFAKEAKLPPHIVPVSICRYRPRWFTGLQYQKLAPSQELLYNYKSTGNTEYYTTVFNNYLQSLNFKAVQQDLAELSRGYDLALLCYERPIDFCHRHLVAQWLEANGQPCQEFAFS